jgi:hypothetical protein
MSFMSFVFPIGLGWKWWIIVWEFTGRAIWYRQIRISFLGCAWISVVSVRAYFLLLSFLEIYVRLLCRRLLLQKIVSRLVDLLAFFNACLLASNPSLCWLNLRPSCLSSSQNSIDLIGRLSSTLEIFRFIIPVLNFRQVLARFGVWWLEVVAPGWIRFFIRFFSAVKYSKVEVWVKQILLNWCTHFFTLDVRAFALYSLGFYLIHEDCIARLTKNSILCCKKIIFSDLICQMEIFLFGLLFHYNALAWVEV